MTSECIPVVYIVGAGRSGSTILDTVLGNHSNIVGVGELCNLQQQGWVNNEYCACGATACDCSYWSEIKTRWIGDNDDKVQFYIDLQKKFERLRSICRLRKFQESLPEDFQEYVQQTENLLRAILTASGKTIIIDSSKRPGRAMALALCPNIDLKVIHLTRDGRGVAWSLNKSYTRDEKSGVQINQPKRSILATAFSWYLVNSAAEYVCSHLNSDNVCHLRYEDFMDAPEHFLAKIELLAGQDFVKEKNMIRQKAAFCAGHTIAGNRLRMAGAVVLKPDMEWRKKMGGFDQFVFRMICGRLMRHYGY